MNSFSSTEPEPSVSNESKICLTRTTSNAGYGPKSSLLPAGAAATSLVDCRRDVPFSSRGPAMQHKGRGTSQRDKRDGTRASE